jgi:hypothetical protein
MMSDLHKRLVTRENQQSDDDDDVKVDDKEDRNLKRQMQTYTEASTTTIIKQIRTRRGISGRQDRTTL